MRYKSALAEPNAKKKNGTLQVQFVALQLLRVLFVIDNLMKVIGECQTAHRVTNHKLQPESLQ